MSTEKTVVGLEPREAESCNICGARNTDTRKIRIDTQRAGNLATFSICRSCLKQMALDICGAYFDFMETAPARTPEPTPEPKK